MTHRLPTFFIFHGGGPCFSMDPPPAWPRNSWDSLAAYLRGFEATLGVRPRAILVISAHWEAGQVAVTTQSRPSLLFDYYGFPPHTYKLTYPVPGAPDVAAEVRALLEQAGISSQAETQRGLDHGVFVPLMLMYPTADIPVLQLSLKQNLNPAEHLAIGRALAPLREQGVLILGSGASFHSFSTINSDREDIPAAAFDTWLLRAVSDSAGREAALATWAYAPGARLAHPREEHLLPLMVAAGAALDDQGKLDFHDRILGKPFSGFRFG